MKIFRTKFFDLTDTSVNQYKIIWKSETMGAHTKPTEKIQKGALCVSFISRRVHNQKSSIR